MSNKWADTRIEAGVPTVAAATQSPNERGQTCMDAYRHEIGGGAQSHLTASEVDQDQYDWFVQNGVAPETARELIAEYNSGGEIDSMSGAKPVEVHTSEIHGWNVTRAEFADGSISVSKVQMPGAEESETTGISVRSVGSCGSTSSGSGWASYYDCAVVGSNGAWLSMEFRASYTRTNANTATIHSVSSPYVHAVGGTADTPSLSIVTATGTTAHAKATTQFNGAYPIGSKTCTLNLWVTGASATTTQNY
ncbi:MULTISPECIES: DUF5626 family protein [unclassified Microbacterium]|uniref:DUF5626 family protein n=1 Tax=unclassified Microbacterium TaxID=2609290 RepID=UPI001604DC1A|nr:MULTISPECIES: DUF5626 family protein [unclassified Microbacterium]QNA93584.1 DUF5626 family protein [Microbacterium sp. Se63.02b]QYM63842.1 DUF5626 family protein [Microbacterium sp. Se5.02b]